MVPRYFLKFIIFCQMTVNLIFISEIHHRCIIKLLVFKNINLFMNKNYNFIYYLCNQQKFFIIYLNMVENLHFSLFNYKIVQKGQHSIFYLLITFIIPFINLTIIHFYLT